VIAHNLCVLIACIHEIGLDVPQFSQRPKELVGWSQAYVMCSDSGLSS
jgi:hypothetical protein